ncbi:MAG: response regulator transcription factor [Sediminibacterium sp.]|jgi:two-component system, NarL family, invasion response regulator UvrY|nr:response regulator transcription factor [Sediminibacterium sp.]MBX9780607.1 response regulator transcription factor [Chitinophagaceae bacterium]
MKKIALVDDHLLLRNGLAVVINSYEGYRVVFEAGNGIEFIQKLKENELPDIVLLDISMPYMNGYETAEWIKKNYPSIKVLVLSMLEDERSVIRMLQYGARGYITKGSDPKELKTALDTLSKKGMYFNQLVYQNLVGNIRNQLAEPLDDSIILMGLKEKEKDFLRRTCSDKSLKEIAADMYLSPRTIDDYRDTLFEKLQVTSRTGLVLFAIRAGLVKL